jgi:trehalose 6-phosphate synthase
MQRRLDDDGNAEWLPSPGGLVTAMEGVTNRQSTAWIGWDGTADVPAEEPSSTDLITVVPIPMTSTECSAFYHGLSNGALWPLYHDAIRRPSFNDEDWDAYRTINRRFAETAAAWVAPGGMVWVHDYHLQLMPAMLRALRRDVRIGFFLHIPFPPPELFLQLPWREDVMKGLLGADVIGFQEPAAASNFAALSRRLGLAQGDLPVLQYGDGYTARRLRVDSYPASIAVEAFEAASTDPEVLAEAEELRARLGHPKKIVLGVDRLDYTKGIEARLEAFRTMVVEQSLTAEDVTMIQVAVPSREDVDLYRQEREHVERIVGEINGQLGMVGAPLIHYLYRSLGRQELLAMYQVADVAMVTPFRDGMNLVAKEYVASRRDDGVLVLSEFAGAARELDRAVLVNPFDGRALVNALTKALAMNADEQRDRMQYLRRAVKAWTASDWASRFLDDLAKPCDVPFADELTLEGP